MSKSVKRVKAAAIAANLDLKIEHMPDSTRTALDAAKACNCTVSQIVKSMVFEGSETGTLRLLLISGDHDVDVTQTRAQFAELLVRTDPKRVRAETGFSIGGVSPIGHLSAIETWMDANLLNHELVWAAAGAPNAVFGIAPADLKTATSAKIFQVE